MIREELDAQTPERARRRAAPVSEAEGEIDLAELLERAGVELALVRDLEEYDLLSPRLDGGERFYPESDADIAATCARFARNGVDARHLRAYRTAAARQSSLIEQLVAPGLRSRDPERRRAALEELDSLSERGAGARAPPADARSERGGKPMSTIDLTTMIRDIPDFPKAGIVFKDLMPLIGDAERVPADVDDLADWSRGRTPDVILGAEARGFIFGGALAYALGCGFVPARKPGKLPWKTVQATYDLEYGTDTLEVHADAIAPGARVIVLDDVLATGGTAAAKVDLVGLAWVGWSWAPCSSSSSRSCTDATSSREPTSTRSSGSDRSGVPSIEGSWALGPVMDSPPGTSKTKACLPLAPHPRHITSRSSTSCGTASSSTTSSPRASRPVTGSRRLSAPRSRRGS